MSLQTPRRPGPGGGTLHIPGLSSLSAASSPNLAAAVNGSSLSSSAMGRKTSLNMLASSVNGAGAASYPNGDSESDIQVGDVVDVPGGMYGCVRFIGPVAGKAGVFAGVELSGKYASLGKNNGSANGIQYFTPEVPGSGIFLPIYRATKRAQEGPPPAAAKPPPTTPSTPSAAVSNFSHPARSVMKAPPIPASRSPPTPSLTKQFSQSVGPGVRPSHTIGLGRPGLVKHSPGRKVVSTTTATSQQAKLRAGGARAGGGGGVSSGSSAFSRSQIGARPTASPAGRSAKPRVSDVNRPYSRGGSRLGYNDDSVASSTTRTTPIPTRPGSRIKSQVSGSTSTANQQAEIAELKRAVEERDRQLQEQSAALAEMETTLAELQSLIPGAATGAALAENGGDEDGGVMTLRDLLREKNERIAMLTAEFDSHRAEFRSTIDSLEIASSETARVYEEKIQALMHENEELRMAGGSGRLGGGSMGGADSESELEYIQARFKTMEAVVAELEEGLEEARRGEAEAKGEVEFLRGEVERGRSELRREREKAANALKAASAESGSDARDDEIRGLKAIIHSLSAGDGGDLLVGSEGEDLHRLRRLSSGSSSRPEPAELERLERLVEGLSREKGELQGLIDRKVIREEEMERELERLKAAMAKLAVGDGERHRDSIGNQSPSVTAAERRAGGAGNDIARLSGRAGVPKSDVPVRNGSNRASASASASATTMTAAEAGGGAQWCDICETSKHDILDCTNVAEDREDGILIGSGGDYHHPHHPQPQPFRTGPPSAGLNAKGGNGTTTAELAERSSWSRTSPMMPNPYDSSLTKGKTAAAADPSKWCALCERDGHDVTDCPFEDIL